MAVDDVKRDSLCGVHPSNKVVLYCKTCEALICTKCVSHSGGGAKHAEHVYLELVEAYDIGQEELEKMLAGFRDDLQSKRAERQELHTKLQKLQLGLLRKKTELGKASRALQDCLCKREKSFMGEVDDIMQPAITQCEQRFKDVEVDVINRDGLLGTSEALQKLPPTRILTFLKSVGGVKRELSGVRRRTFTEYEEDRDPVRRLETVHLNLSREKYLVDKAFTFPSKPPDTPRVLPGWCVISHNASVLCWKYNKSDTVKHFNVYVKPVTYSDKKYADNYETRVKTMQIKEPKPKVKCGSPSKAQTQDSKSKQMHQSKGAISTGIKTRSTHTRDESAAKTTAFPKLNGSKGVQKNISPDVKPRACDKDSSKPKWWRLSSWRKSSSEDDGCDLKKSESESGKSPGISESGDGREDTPSWYVVEPVRYVESLCGQEEEVHESLSKSIALTEALRRRSQGLSKKSSVSDQYLYTPVFRPKTESTSLFGSKNKLNIQGAIKEHDSKEKLDVSEKDVDTLKEGKSEKDEVVYKTISHQYTAIDPGKLNSEDFRRIRVSKFVPGRVQVVLRDLHPGEEYMACITAVNQCGESEAVVVHFKTSGCLSPSVLQTQCTLKGKYEMLHNALKYTFQMLVFFLGLALFGFLVSYLYAHHVHYVTCSHVAMTLDDVDSMDLHRVCPQVTEDYTCVYNKPGTEESWISKTVQYFTAETED